MLACTADGGKLPPYIVFKRKTLPKGMRFPRGVHVHVRVHPKGWMDEALTLDWIKTVWATRPGGLPRKKAMLVLDSFRCHRMPSIKSELRGMKTDLVIIPGGMTTDQTPAATGRQREQANEGRTSRQVEQLAL